MSVPDSARILLVDQSIHGLGGHHWEYARRVLAAARSAGLEPVLATNRSLDRDRIDPEGLRILACFELDFWGRRPEAEEAEGPGLFAGWARRTGLAWERMLMATRFSWAGRIWLARGDPALACAILQEAPLAVRLRIVFASLLILPAYAAWRVAVVVFSLLPGRGRLAALAGHAGRALLQAARLLCFIVRLLLGRAGLEERRRAHAFARDLATALRQAGLRPGDLVFVPTISPAELGGLGDLLARDRRARELRWRLLFRRNLFEGLDHAYPQQREAVRAIRNQFSRFQRNSAGIDVALHTDTDELARQYAWLGLAHNFTVLPIPAWTAAVETRPTAVPVLGYLGDARTEKGYQHLPGMVRDCSADPASAAGWEIQSNFNTTEGEPPCVVARADLMGMRGRVRLHLQPLSGPDYLAALARMDVVVIPYDRERYYARSSSVFAEALCAGRPVLVPAGTWMAMSLAEAHRAHHDRLAVGTAVSLAADDLVWRLGQDGGSGQRAGCVLVGPVANQAWLTVPPGITALVLRGAMPEGVAGVFLAINFEWLDRDDAVVGRDERVVGGRAGVAWSAACAVPAGCVRLRLGLSTPFGPQVVALPGLAIALSRASGALDAVGRIFHRHADLSPMLREMVRHLGHYRTTAQSFQTAWAAWHEPGRLIGMLARRRPG